MFFRNMTVNTVLQEYFNNRGVTLSITNVDELKSIMDEVFTESEIIKYTS